MTRSISLSSFVCQKCNIDYKFPRYHDQGGVVPQDLLEWRKGRREEWVNCFALILRSVGFETRRVMDWNNDYEWCEVFSQADDRWVHTDPCENAMDRQGFFFTPFFLSISH